MLTFKNLFFLCAIALVCGVISCVEKVEEFPLNYGYNYFPLKKGKYIVYDVDSVTYDILPQGAHNVAIDTVSFQVKELVADTLRDAQGRPSFKLEYYTRKNATQPWTVRKVWFATRTDQNAERVEDNLRFVKLSFPIIEPSKPGKKDGSRWNGAKYIDPLTQVVIKNETLDKPFDDWESEYSNVDKQYTQGNRTFDSTLTVTHVDLKDDISNKVFYKEVYGRNIGLIYKRLEMLSTQCGLDEQTNPCSKKNASWYVRAEKGFVLEMRLKELN
jgi:hypothetical protein